MLEDSSASAGNSDAWRRIKFIDLARWRGTYGWDKNSVMADAQVGFDAATLQLTFSAAEPLPRVPAVDRIDSDMLGKPTGPTRIAGPIAGLSTRHSWIADPRLRA
jgi:hypothetical protein